MLIFNLFLFIIALVNEAILLIANIFISTIIEKLFSINQGTLGRSDLPIS